ncbi:MAG TPA: uracil phosphoribosyltransferase [Chthoniobacterales bacterium]|nr:uracil phosphoribosyltransferase [Chthoniobacterales bacterium]
MSSAGAVTVLRHPPAAVALTTIRGDSTPTDEFRRNLQQLSVLLLAEASRDWLTESTNVETPLRQCDGAALTRRAVLVPILRAGLGMLDGMLQLLPAAKVGHLGLYRDEATLRPVTYYSRVPKDLETAEVLLLDPMLATGQSAAAAAAILKANGARSVRLVCVVACPPGIQHFTSAHPDVPIVAAAIDPELNDVGYIVPGLGDAGDRYFGTR